MKKLFAVLLSTALVTGVAAGAMLTAREIQSARNQAVREIDAVFADLLQALGRNQAPEQTAPDEDFDVIYPLSFNAAEFKGKKPTSLHFGRETVPVYSWKMVFSKIVKRCNADASKHKTLMDLRSKISGRARLILSDRPDGTRAAGNRA